MTAPSTFLYAHDRPSGVVTITLNRPERLNALTFDVYAELAETFASIGDEPEVRVVVLTGAGKAFCSGGDVHEIIGPLLSREPHEQLAFTRFTCRLIANIRACPRPVIAALNGTAAGAGAVIAAACDLRIAASSARIAFLFTKVGLSGADMGAAWLLPRIVGCGRATELLFTGEFIGAEEAYRIGLYNQVVPDGEALAKAAEIAARLSQGPSRALTVTKRALDREASIPLAGALDEEAELQAALMQHADFREAYEAFCERRPPRFK
ncbi:MAG: enoyl-CoA hydratase family protein [Acidobacteriota bacterium]